MNDANAVDPNMVGFIAVLVFLLGVLLGKIACWHICEALCKLEIWVIRQERGELLLERRKTRNHARAERKLQSLGETGGCGP